jgi:DNA-binding phage protein
MPRPVHVSSVQHIGKEVIVDETDADNDLTAEMLTATDVLLYDDPIEHLERLRADVREHGIKTVARTANVSRSQVQAFVTGTATPRAATVAKIEASIEILGSR